MQPFTIVNNEARGQFQLVLDDNLAWLEYRIRDGVIVLMHTDVPDLLGGKGIGTALAAYAFDYARAHHLSVKVYCPFVQKYVQRHPELSDIIVSQS